MKIGLRQKLNTLIKSRNGQVVTLQEIEFICKRDSYKLSNAERRLRASESPNVIPYKKDGAIIGYYWKMLQTQPSITAQEFLNRFPSRVEEKEKEVNTLF